jgi:hypothetical protein
MFQKSRADGWGSNWSMCKFSVIELYSIACSFWVILNQFMVRLIWFTELVLRAAKELIRLTDDDGKGAVG